MFFLSLEKDKVSCIGYNFKNLVRGLCERLKKKSQKFLERSNHNSGYETGNSSKT